ncbi:MAG: MopE-related protein, partial [Myxococcota bacterium]|nr:MopE-related protein [Myxococcota bacterium]
MKIVGLARWLGTMGVLAGALGCGQDVTVTTLARELVVSPTLVDVGTVSIGTTETVEVTLESVQGGDIKIKSVTVDNQSGSYFQGPTELVVVPDLGMEILEMSYTPEEEGYHWAIATIVSDAKESTFEVELRGQAVLNEANAWPLVLDFGEVAVGETASLELTVSNGSSTDLYLTSAFFSSPQFSLESEPPIFLFAGEDMDVTVLFSPMDEDPAEATLGLDIPDSEGLSEVLLRGNDCENGTPSAYDVDEDGVATCGGDCDDSDPDVHPGADETYDEVDEDCDGIVDEGTEGYDDDGDGYSEIDGDCNDSESDVGPDESEISDNGIDDDCDGTVDSGTVDSDGDGYTEEAGDCDTSDADVYPGAPEIEDGVDNDCDETVDEGTDSYDDDGDGYTEDEGDCHDGDTSIHPSASELEDWMDNDCDGTVDE